MDFLQNKTPLTCSGVLFLQKKQGRSLLPISAEYTLLGLIRQTIEVLKVKKIHFLLCSCFIVATAVVGELAQSQLETNRVIYQAQVPRKVIALTIDDGPHYKTTPEILEVLRQKQVKVTFFVLGVNAEQSPALLAQEVRDGHEIGSHAYSHASLPALSQKNIEEELNKTEKIILAQAPQPALFRPPGGMLNKKVIEIAEQKGYKVVLWSIDPHDWQRPSTEKVINFVLKEAKPGSIVLLHDGQYPLPTPRAIGTIIDALRKDGYEFVTVSELLQYKNESYPSITSFKDFMNRF